jgi:cell division protease FtsH
MAEALVFGGNVSTGAADDLQRATEVAQEMVTRYGMAEGLGNRAYASSRHAFLDEVALPPTRPEVSEATAREIDLAVRNLVEAGARRAGDIPKMCRTDLGAGTQLLLERETLAAEDFPLLRRAAA